MKVLGCTYAEAKWFPIEQGRKILKQIADKESFFTEAEEMSAAYTAILMKTLHCTHEEATRMPINSAIFYISLVKELKEKETRDLEKIRDKR